MTLASPHFGADFSPSRLSGRALPGFVRSVTVAAGGLWRRCLAWVAAPACRVSAPSVRVDLPGGDRSIQLVRMPMSAIDQWQRAIRPLEAATASATAMRELHAAAGKQLCSVDYALEQLIDDLSSIMTVPRAARASLHALRPLGPVQFADDRSAAIAA